MSTQKRTVYSKVISALALVLIPSYISVSSSGKVSHPGDFELLTTEGNLPLIPAAPAPAATAKAAATAATAKRAAPERAMSRLPFAAEIALAAKNNGIDALLLTAVVKTESRFDASAISPRGAIGLMQIRPDEGDVDPQLLLDPAHNLQRGAAYLRAMLDLFGGDLRLALAAYNAGPSAVRRFGGLPPYGETETFVTRVLATYLELHRTYEPAGQVTVH